MRALRHPSEKRAGFLLLEAMLAVAIFGLGVIALGRCVQNCMRAERIRREEGLAQRLLANYLTQIETEALPISDKMTEQLKGAWEGMTMNITREQMKLQNEKEQELFGLYKVTLDVSWRAGREDIHRSLSFIFYPKQR
jgi:type II secretory pathway pseudopilin PulG